jgi:hypothetical protein
MDDELADLLEADFFASVPATSAAALSTPSHATASSGACGGPTAMAPASQPVPGVVYPASLEGRSICVSQYREPGMPKYYKRLFADCPLSGITHLPRCTKFRSCGPRTELHLGVLEPAAFIGAWLQAAPSFPDRAAHLAHNPSRADVLEYFREQGWAT